MAYPYPGKQKYGNRKTVVNGIRFDSQREADRYQALLFLQRIHQISGLERQVKFELIPAQRDERGKVIEHACNYYADFVYVQNGKTVVEDAKGFQTPEYKIKRKLMLQKYGIKIREV